MTQVITNNQPRNLTYGYDLTAKQREDFDYIDADDFDSHDFVIYRGQVYDVSEFERSNIKGWDGQHCDSFYSAVVIKLLDNGEQAIMGLALS